MFFGLFYVFTLLSLTETEMIHSVTNMWLIYSKTGIIKRSVLN